MALQWDIDSCITDSGGKVAEAAKNEWYVDHKKKICHQNCLKDTSETQYGVDGLRCGGLAPESSELYGTVEECCDSKLSYINQDVCVANSRPPPSAPRGSNRWYVNWMEEKCVQDCNSKFNRLASVVSCGGIVSDASVVLYDSPYDCCAERLDWLNTTECFQRSIEISTGWLNDLVEELTGT